jgi:hypothetical protein
MKSLIYSALLLAITVFYSSCSLFEEDDNTSIGGDQSSMGQVGVTISSSSMEISGVKDLFASVTANKDGVSTYSGKAVVTNTFFKNLLSNFPEIVMKGDTATTETIQFKNSKDGIEFKSGPTRGILVKYASEVGDKYPINGIGGNRTVVSKSTTDDYPYGFYLIKVIQVEEYPSVLRSSGINKITYWGNHKFGLVGVDFSFDDGTSASFPLYTSAEN